MNICSIDTIPFIQTVQLLVDRKWRLGTRPPGGWRTGLTKHDHGGTPKLWGAVPAAGVTHPRLALAAKPTYERVGRELIDLRAWVYAIPPRSSELIGFRDGAGFSRRTAQRSERRAERARRHNKGGRAGTALSMATGNWSRTRSGNIRDIDERGCTAIGKART